MRVAVGSALKGRVIDGLGNPIDSLGPVVTEHTVGLNLRPPHPLKRQRIHEVFQTGIKSVDTFTPCGRGQRLGIFAGSGVGKSTLLGMMASQAEADVNVIALIGERGREVREFLERDLDERGPEKIRGHRGHLERAGAEPREGRVSGHGHRRAFPRCRPNVLLMMDSVTRFAMAQREIGLAVGEPPTTRGYTPSVFSLLPQLLERAGAGETGSITGLFTVLVEADDMNDPIADAVRSILDGHIVLTRELATQNHYPAIDVLESVSRLNRDLLPPEQIRLTAAGARASGGVPEKPGSDQHRRVSGRQQCRRLTRPLRCTNPLNRFLRQGVTEGRGGICSIGGWNTASPPTGWPSSRRGARF
jgi:flagellum-specific ATP synthase